MNEIIRAIEDGMLSEAKQIVADDRLALDLIAPSVMEKVRSILGYGPFSTELWLVSPCSFLDGQRPIDIYDIDVDSLFRAAEHKANKVQHG